MAEEEVAMLEELRDSSKDLVYYLQEMDEKFSILTEQSAEAATVLSNWQGVFGLMHVASSQQQHCTPPPNDNNTESSKDYDTTTTLNAECNLIKVPL